MRALLSSTHRFLRKPSNFAILLMVSAAAFTWLDQKIADTDETCRRDADRLEERFAEERYLQLSLQLLQIKMSLNDVILVNIHGSKANALTEANLDLYKKSVSVAGLLDTNKTELKNLRYDYKSLCSSSSSLHGKSSLTTLLITLLAGAYGFWAGSRKS